MNNFRQEKITKIEHDIKNIKLRLIEKITQCNTYDEAKALNYILEILIMNYEDLQDLKDR